MTTEKKRDEESPARAYGRQREKALRFGYVIWWAYVIFKIVGYILAVSVPFGLAALAYLSSTYHATINLALIVASFSALAIQAILDALRFKDRALTVRSSHAMIAAANVRWDNRLIDDSQLMDIIASAQQRIHERELP